MLKQVTRRVFLLTAGSLGLLMASSGSGWAAPEWEMTGSRIIGCCCATPCPCRVNKPPAYMHGCDGTSAVRIDRGRFGKTRMDGVTFALVGRAFGHDVEGNWGYVYVVDTATDEQVKALQGMLEGSVKAMGSRAKHLAGKPLGMRKVPMTYEVSSDRRFYGVTIPDILEFKTRSIILPGHTKPAVSTGIFDQFGDRLVHADCLTHTYNDPQIKQSWDLTGRQCNQADFNLTSDTATKGGLGWACWSAHAEFGASEKYQEQILEDREHAKK